MPDQFAISAAQAGCWQYCVHTVHFPEPLTGAAEGRIVLPRAAPPGAAEDLESRILRRDAGEFERQASGRAARPADHLKLFFFNTFFSFWIQRGPLGAPGRRVRSWLRTNAGGAPNTCKSSGGPAFGPAISGERASNAWATCPPPWNSRGKPRVMPDAPRAAHAAGGKAQAEGDGPASHQPDGGVTAHRGDNG